MSEQQTQEPQGKEQATRDGAAQSNADSQSSDYIKDLSKVDPKVLQQALDAHADKAMKTYKDNVAKQLQEKQKQDELKAAEERGEWDKLKADYESQLAKLRIDYVTKDVKHSLDNHARELGLIDSELVSLVLDEAVETAVAEDGTVDDSKVKAVLEKLKAEKPVLFSDNKRFTGARTPVQPQDVPAPVSPVDTDAYIKQRNEKFREMTKPPRRRGTVDALAEAVARRLGK